MTRLELEAQLDRFAHAGYRMPDDVPGMFAEWFDALERYEPAQVEAGVTRLIRTRTSSFWPVLADVLEAVRVEQSGRPSSPRGCATCHGTTWMEAPPYRANGGLVYRGVRRCPDCGVPPPNTAHLERTQASLSASELCEWANAQRPVEPMTHDEMLARVHAIAGRMQMPRRIA